MKNSAKRISKMFNDQVKTMDWKQAKNPKIAFIDEFMRMSEYGFDFFSPNNPDSSLYNLIMSPGAKYFAEWFQ